MAVNVPPKLRRLFGMPAADPEPADAGPVPARPPGKPVKRRPARWWTPWTWVSAGGVYVGDDGAWLYRTLPMDLLPTDGLAALVADDDAPAGADIHLLLHAWSSPIEEATLRTTGTRLDDYLADTIRLYAPVRRLIIGVKLADTMPAKMSTLAAVYETIDTVLGENVPDMSRYDTSAEAVDRWLTRYGATPLDRVSTDMLESWYTLGHPTNVAADEKDTHIRLSDGHLLTFATANPDPTSNRHAPAPPLPPPPRAAVVASARAQLSDAGLTGLAVVYGRRALGALPWTDTLRSVMPSANPAGLPLRQLPALDETLPCSTSRLNPASGAVPSTTLAQVGFVNPAPVGDAGGLFVGMGGIGYTDPVRFNPLATGGNPLHLYGGQSSGKTFLAEHLGLQAMMAGMTVRYLSGDGDAGRALVEAGAAAVAEPSPGMFDPGRLPSAFATFRRAVLAGVASATPQVGSEVFERASSRTLADQPRMLPALAETAELIYSPRDAALLRRAAQREHTLAWATCRPGTGMPAGSAAWSVPHITHTFIEDYGTREAATELLVAAALLADIDDDSPGLLVIIDGIRTGSLVELALAAAAVTARTIGVITTSRTLPGQLSGFCLLGAGLDPQQVATVAGVGMLDTNLAGRRTYADIDASHVVQSAATWTARDRHGRVSPLVAAPVGADLLPRLTRRPDTIYK